MKFAFSKIIICLIASALAIKPAMAAGQDPVVGKWKWSDGFTILTLHPDGTATDRRQGKWICLTPNAAPRKYRLIWPNIMDTVTLVKNGTELVGQNDRNQKIRFTRDQGSEPVAGNTVGAESLREALIGYSWTLNSPARNVQIRFLADGTYSDGTTGAWKIVGERTIQYGDNCVLTFDESLTKYEGYNSKRKWKLRGERQERIDGSPSVAATPTPAPSPTPGAVVKTTLEILAEDGPLITDQVLSALDQPSIPEATVTLWKEDLLDESVQAAPALQSAYKQGALLLDAWKAALRERYRLIEETKFSGAVMERHDMQSGRKTVLHMWDWLQYARERDDAAKHEKKLERTAEFFASGPPRRWAERSAILRGNIENLYKGLRKSLREL